MQIFASTVSEIFEQEGFFTFFLYSSFKWDREYFPAFGLMTKI